MPHSHFPHGQQQHDAHCIAQQQRQQSIIRLPQDLRQTGGGTAAQRQAFGEQEQEVGWLPAHHVPVTTIVCSEQRLHATISKSGPLRGSRQPQAAAAASPTGAATVLALLHGSCQHPHCGRAPHREPGAYAGGQARKGGEGECPGLF